MRVSKLQLIGGLAAGAAAVYLLDPARGRRRRALIRDKAVKIEHKLVDKGAGKAKDLANRGKGVVSRMRRRNGDDPAEYLEQTAMARMDTADEARNAAEDVAAVAHGPVSPSPD